MKYTSVAGITFAFIIAAKAIWPPSYTVNLTQQANFVVFEEFGTDDDDSYSLDDEMIKNDEVGRYNLVNDENKYFMLHHLTKRKNTENKDEESNKKQQVVPMEGEYYDEPQMSSAGFVNGNGEFLVRV